MRKHHEIVTVEAIGTLGLLAPLLLRPAGEWLKRITRREPAQKGDGIK
jgi:hypothetical protein